jgi:KipI family sensor histidine kinase inhibitor
MRILPASDSALFISFGDTISLEIHRRVISLFHAIHRAQDPRIRDLHPGYASLLIDFDALRLTHAELEHRVLELVRTPLLSASDNRGSKEIPVCYDQEFGPDLPQVAQYARLPEEQIVTLHSQGDYFVYFLGFSPGFAYLGGLSRQLHVPRLPTPRKQVRAGSVGLAGEQTGVYPSDSPGGWQLIGRTPLAMFDSSATLPSRLLPGDRVRFRPIDRSEFDRLATKGHA